MPELEVWLCPAHSSLDESGKLQPLDNCVACLRAERDELRAKIAAAEERERRLREALVEAKAWLPLSPGATPAQRGAKQESFWGMFDQVTAALAQPSEAARTDGELCWFVEARVGSIDGKFDGWFANPEYGVGGWLTEDPLKAHRYAQSEAVAVAKALTYFHTPFRYLWWIATEHEFIDTALGGRA